jgi:flagellar biosynthesis chaperone FliJ
MAASRALRRLLRIRDLEEEQSRLALESSLGELSRLQEALRATVDRERQGRRLIESSARTGELPDRLAGLEEAHAVDRLFAVLAPRIAAKEEEVAMRRREYLLKRMERRQSETLIENAEAEEAVEAARRGQQVLDDWYSARQYRQKLENDSPAAADRLPAQAKTSAEPSAGEHSWIVDES